MWVSAVAVNVTVLANLVKENECTFCGSSLADHRVDATYCSNDCRAEAWRLSRLLAEALWGAYTCLADRHGRLSPRAPV